MKKMFFFFIIWIGVSGILSGCIALPGQEPFGEHTYSNEDAQSIYKDVCTKMKPMKFSDWKGYSIHLSEGGIYQDIYHTEEYTVAWYEGTGKEYLWYQGRLYRYDGDSIVYRNVDWEILQSELYVEQQWELSLALLDEESQKLNYKSIPMASQFSYLLKAEYSEIEWNGQVRRFPELSFQLDKNKEFHTVSLHWQEQGSRVIDINFFPYKNSTNLQAERKIWSFAYELGLIDKKVPALTMQQDDRKGSQSIIASINFDKILEKAEYRSNLTFPVFSDTRSQ